AAQPGSYLAGRAEVLGERVQAGEPSVHAVFEDDLTVLLGDAHGEERRPGEAAVERVVVAGYGVLGGVDLAVHDEQVVRSQQGAQLACGGEWVEGTKRVAEQENESRRRLGVRGEGREVIGAGEIGLDPLGRESRPHRRLAR